MVMVQDINQPVQDFGKGAAGFTGMEHAAVQGRKNSGVFPEPVVQASALPDVLGDGHDNPLELDVFGLIFKHLEEG